MSSSKGYGGRNSEDTVTNGGKETSKLCERNVMEVLRGKHGEDGGKK